MVSFGIVYCKIRDYINVNLYIFLYVDTSPQPILDGGDGQHRLVMNGTNVDPTEDREEG